MKTLYESLLTGNVTKPRAKAQPSSEEELSQIIDGYIEDIKPRPGQEVDFNWIDISKVDDLSGLFMGADYIPVIDKWDITHVKNFGYMFCDNKHIVRSPLPVLQTKLLSDKCYEGMFWGCNSLEAAPELPAKKLTDHCYESMFWGCKALEVAPQLSATRLAEDCYQNMFALCQSLVMPPDLPAKKLVSGCYRCMFEYCKSLTKKAKIPAGVNDQSRDYCQLMYEGCPCEQI